MSEQNDLKIVFVGHVDHGKSSLIGRLLYDTGAFPEAKYESIKKICDKQGKKFEYAFLLDAFEEEQTQGVTIEVSHIKFKSKKRGYTIIDAPGHKEFLKNMITGASSADAAVLLVDANEGIQEQTKRHSHLISLLGIRNIIVVINKMDLVGYGKTRYEAIIKELSPILEKLDIKPVGFVPISAIDGENIIKGSDKIGWYEGASFLENLDLIEVDEKKKDLPLRLPVQDVYKFDERRIIAGRIESGSLSVGDKVVFLPSNKTSTVKTIEENKKNAVEGESVGITIEHPLYLERGEICSLEDSCPRISDKFVATIFWIGKKEIKKGDSIIIKLTTEEVQATIASVDEVMDSDTLEYSIKKDSISKNDVANVTFECKSPIAFDIFSDLLKTGRFVMVDDNGISGGGIIKESKYPDRRVFFSKEVKSPNISWEKGKITSEDREKIKKHKGSIIWLTGLSGSGKSTIAKELEVQLHKKNVHTFILDGDNVRHGLNADLGFSPEDRMENIRRIGEVSKLFSDSGLIVITSFISPYHHDRDRVRKIAKNRFIEVFVDCSLEECKKRDTKGLYKKALAGEIKDFTGVSSPYEEPTNPEIMIDTKDISVEENVSKIMKYLENNRIV